MNSNSKHYIIGDVHGEYQTLLKLLQLFNKDSYIYFVGDIIDRGVDSAKIVSLIRENGYKMVLGNHEVVFIKYVSSLLAGENINDLKEKWKIWIGLNGGKETLISYGLWGGTDYSKELLAYAKSDLDWMKSLPLYIELDVKHKSGKKIIISHSNISSVWHLKDDEKQKELFENTLLRSRDTEFYTQCEIFNIYGHVPQRLDKVHKKDSIIIDTGCCYEKDGYGLLSAYCVEDDEILSVKKVIVKHYT